MDEAKIADPEARKPDDWDEDAPLTIPDMDAVKVRSLEKLYSRSCVWA